MVSSSKFPAHDRFCEYLENGFENELGSIATSLLKDITTQPQVYSEWSQPFPLPFFVTGEQWDQWKRASEKLINLIKRFTCLMIARYGLPFIASLGVGPELLKVAKKSLWSVPASVGLARPDFFVGNNGPIFIEANIDSSLGGLGTADALHRCIQAAPKISEYLNRCPVARENVCEKLALLLRDVACKNDDVITVAIVDWEDEINENPLPYDCLQRDLTRFGVEIIVAGENDISSQGARFVAKNKTIDVVLRGIMPGEKLRTGIRRFDQLWNSHLHGTTPIISNLWAPIFSSKALFGAIHKARANGFLSKDDADFVDMHIPWTWQMSERNAWFDNKEIDLIKLAITQQENFIIKSPLDGSCKNVFIGRKMTPNHWKFTVSSAVSSPGYIIQKYIQPNILLNADPARNFSNLIPYHCNFAVFLFDGTAAGTCIRGISEENVLISCTHGAREGVAFVEVRRG